MEITTTKAYDGFATNPARGGDPAPEKNKRHALDSDAYRKLLSRLEDWWQEARDAHAPNRREQMQDADYYDTIQWQAADAATLLGRGQAPLSFPIIKQLCDWIIGTERRTRIDWDVLPRKNEDVQLATVKKEVLKWVSDINGAGWERSRQFADVVKVGIGWTEECYNNDESEEPITVRHQDWKGIWWDPYSRSNVMRDARYITRAKWLDLDYSIAMFPDRADELTARAVNTLDPVQEQLDIEATLPAMFYGTSNPLNSGNVTGNWSLSGGAAIATRSRKRVLVLETWYKQSANTPLILGDDAGDLNGQRFDRHNSEHEALLGLGTVSLVDSVTESMQYALWTPGLLLRAGPTPYKHQKFPFTPSWGYRAHRDGMPYGPIRPARDAQDEYNKRRSKILYDLATNRVVYESDAMDEADENRNLDEAKRPDGEIRLSPGGMEKFKIDRALDALQGQIAMLSEAKQNIYESSGVTRENTGTSTGDQSGRAILAKQQQGATTTAELFDNYRQAIQESGQKTLSNCEKFLTLPKLVRIAGDGGAVDFLAINTPQLNPETGEVMWDNDITASEADFVVDQSDYRETVRMAMAEMLFELIGKMPGEAGIQLLDIAVDMTDLPNKAALAARIRTMNHQPAPGQEQSPEQQAQAQSSAQAQQAAAQLAQAGQVASVRLTNAQAAKNEAEAKKVAVTGKTDALNAAGMLAAALPLAPAADRLWDPTEAAQILAPPPNQ